MHHNVLADGSVLLLDAFGLTRVAPNLRAKTDAKTTWHPHYRLSGGGLPQRVIAPRATWESLLLDIDTLAVVAKLRGGHALLPDGERYVMHGVDGVFDLAHQTLSSARRRDGEPRGTILVNDGLYRPARILLGPSVSDDRVALVWNGVGACELTLFDVPASGARARWRVELRAGTDTVIAPTLVPGGVAVVGWRPGERRATVVDLDAEGAPRASITLPSLGMPAIDGDRVVTQPDEDTVRVTDRRTGVTRDHALTEAVEKAPRRKGAPSPLDPRGIGVVIAGRARTLFAPAHGETVMDLDQGHLVDRKLPADQRPLRTAFAKWVDANYRRLLASGMLAPSLIRGGASARVALWCPVPHGTPTDALATLKALGAHLHEATGVSLRSVTTMP